MLSSTTLDPGHRMKNDKNTRKHQIQESQEVSPFLKGEHKAARNRHHSMATPNTNNKKDPQKKHRLGRILKIYPNLYYNLLPTLLINLLD